jgi:hypothetical protein
MKSVSLPKNYKIDELPENVTINSEFGIYKLNFVKNGEELKVNRTIRINKGLYPKEKYNDYVNFRKKPLTSTTQKF